MDQSGAASEQKAEDLDPQEAAVLLDPAIRQSSPHRLLNRLQIPRDDRPVLTDPKDVLDMYKFERRFQGIEQAYA